MVEARYLLGSFLVGRLDYDTVGALRPSVVLGLIFIPNTNDCGYYTPDPCYSGDDCRLFDGFLHVICTTCFVFLT